MSRRFLILSTLGVTAVAGCGEEPGRLPRVAEPADVSVSVVARAPAVLSFPATVVSEREAEVATRVAGAVERVYVEVGTRVRGGDPLVALVRGDVDARVAGTRARESLAERTFRRIESLAREGAASEHELDGARAEFDGARAARLEAEAQEAYAVVRAPFDGVITARRVDPGDLAVPGGPLVALVAPGDLKVVADVPGSLLGEVWEGMPIVVRGGSSRVSARVDRLMPVLEGPGRTFRLEARLEGAPDDLVAGAYVRLELEEQGRGTRWVPADALIARGQLTGVYAVESDTLRLRWVRLGRRMEGAVELLSGPPGDISVVRRPDAGLWDGRPVGSARAEAWEPGAFAATTLVASTEVDR